MTDIFDGKQSAVALRIALCKRRKRRRIFGVFRIAVIRRRKLAFGDFAVLHQLPVHDFNVAVGILLNERYLVRYYNYELGFGYLL